LQPPKVILVLSDLYGLFASPKQGPVAKKLLFYIAALKVLSREEWLLLERECLKEVGKLNTEMTNEDKVEEDAKTCDYNMILSSGDTLHHETTWNDVMH